MLKVVSIIRKTILCFFLVISFIGFVLSITLNFKTLLNYRISDFVVLLILGVPIVFIPSVIIAVIKTSRSKGYSNSKYGIRFWPAVKNVPNWMISIIYILILYVIIMTLVSTMYTDHGEKIITGVDMIFYYIPLIIYFSSIKGD